MIIYRCLICGEPYLGTDRPSNCPSCGALSKNLVPATRWFDPKVSILSEASRRDLERGMDIEVKNSIFFERASKNTVDLMGQALFMAFARLKTRHAALIGKMLGFYKPPLDFSESFEFDTNSDILSEANRREKATVDFFKKASAEATEPRVRQVLSALAEITTFHLELLKR